MKDEIILGFCYHQLHELRGLIANCETVTDVEYDKVRKTINALQSTIAETMKRLEPK